MKNKNIKNILIILFYLFFLDNALAENQFIFESNTIEYKDNMFNSGDIFISMNQKRSNLIAELLEPEAPNSYVSFGIIKTSINSQLPIYRIKNFTPSEFDKIELIFLTFVLSIISYFFVERPFRNKKSE